jgi:Zn-dependent M28 family amino/carboxypeptidase
MKSNYILFVLFVLLISFFYNSSAQNPIIQNVVNEVSSDSIFKQIGKLEKLERYAYFDGLESQNYVTNYLNKLNFDTVFTQEYGAGWSTNVIAVKYGTNLSDSIYVVGAHYDCYNKSAPGADDNASGTAGLMEIARIISTRQPEKTVMIAFFSGEEEGLYGSYKFVEKLLEKNIPVAGMFNLDMISYLQQGQNPKVSIRVNKESLPLMNKFISTINSYAPELSFFIDSLNPKAITSDHNSFWAKKIKALTLIEGAMKTDHYNNPYFHSDKDRLGIAANSSLLAELITKSVLATLIENTESFEYLGKALVYPNPTNAFVHIYLNNIKIDKAQIEIYNIYGQLVEKLLNWKQGELIDFSHKAKGIYFIKMSSPSYNNILKIIKE